MPFSATTKERNEEYWTNHFEIFLGPLIGETGFEAYRSTALRGDILNGIITDLVTAPIVVADLTDMNANVCWELGVRQSFKHGTITIAEEGTKLPFDLGKKGTLYYSPGNHIKDARFRHMFKEAVQDCVTNPSNPDSHVLEVISGRGSLFEILQLDQAIRRFDAVASEYEQNARVLELVLKTCEANKKEPDKRSFVTRRFRLNCIELLVTTRYLDEGADFYSFSEAYMSALMVWNGQLELWGEGGKATEDWFMKDIARNGDTYSKFGQLIEDVQNRLRSRL